MIGEAAVTLLIELEAQLAGDEDTLEVDVRDVGSEELEADGDDTDVDAPAVARDTAGDPGGETDMDVTLRPGALEAAAIPGPAVRGAGSDDDAADDDA